MSLPAVSGEPAKSRSETAMTRRGGAFVRGSIRAEGGSVTSETVHSSAEMRFSVSGHKPQQSGHLNWRVMQISVQVLTFAEGFSSSMVMLWNGRSLLLMAA